jgi:uncharacterized protein YecT (DUF1311 family)
MVGTDILERGGMLNILGCVKRCLLVVVGLSFSVMAFAQGDCKDGGAGESTIACSEFAKKEADAKLNNSYKELMGRAESRYIFQYQSQPEMQKGFLSKLKDSQRAWIKLRDTNCALEGFENEWDKPAYTMELNNCIARMSLERVLYLDGIIPVR